MSRSILVPLDDSPQSKTALEHALSTYPTAEITVLHVINTMDGVAFGGEMAVKAQEESAEQKTEALFAEVQQLADGYQTEFSTATTRGSPSRAINDYVREHGIDHVIMGSHGRTGVKRIIFGSVAEEVVRRAPVPVTIVR